MPVVFAASESQYAQHLRPIAAVLGQDVVAPSGDLPMVPTVVAGIGDAQRLPDRPLALVEHGAGQTYGGRNPAYAGGDRRERFGLFVVPSQRVADANLARYPDTPNAVVGCPFLDKWLPAPEWVAPPDPVVAISFHEHHASSDLGPFGWNAWHVYAPVLSELSSRWQTLGHAHPRFWSDDLVTTYRAHCLEPVRSWPEVIDRADVYVVDSSSTAFEFAALGRPVVWLNTKWYPRDRNIGLRFWSHVDVGVQCDRPEQLAEKVAEAIDTHPQRRERQAELVAEIYEVRTGESSALAAGAIMEWAERAGS